MEMRSMRAYDLLLVADLLMGWAC